MTLPPRTFAVAANRSVPLTAIDVTGDVTVIVATVGTPELPPQLAKKTQDNRTRERSAARLRIGITVSLRPGMTVYYPAGNSHDNILILRSIYISVRALVIMCRALAEPVRGLNFFRARRLRFKRGLPVQQRVAVFATRHTVEA